MNRVLGILLLVICLTGAVRAEPQPRENRAAKIYEWCERGEWFDFPPQFMPDGSGAPTIGSGWLVEDAKRSELDWRYIHELEFHAGVISRCGTAAVGLSLEKLRSDDHYIAIVAALALDKLLGVELGYDFAHGRATLEEVAKAYRERADLCYPERGKETPRPEPAAGIKQ